MILLLAEHVQQAGGALLWLVLGVVAAGIAGAYLARGAKQKKQFDDRPPRLVDPGDPLNYVIGRRLVSSQPVVTFNRFSREEPISGGGKKGGFFGGPEQKQTVYYEAGVHLICLGPATALHKILEGDEVVFEGPVTPDDTPSGSALQDLSGNTFYIWWGEKTQPVNTRLGVEQALGVESRWPYYCYIEYPSKKLGGSATWPQTDIEIECKCTAAFPLPDSACDVGDGQNGAHILYQLMTGDYPHGVGMRSGFGWTSLIELGELIESEGVGQNIAIVSDTSVGDVIAEVLTDLSVLMPEDQGGIIFKPLRSDDTAFDITENVAKAPLPTFEIRHGSYEHDRIIFNYPDRELNYRDGDVTTDDDATARAFFRRKSRTVPMSTITNLADASTIADRRKQLIVTDSTSVRFSGSRTMRRLVPGHAVNFDGIGRLRITSVKRDAKGGSSSIVASVDQYTPVLSGWSPETPPPVPSTGARTPDTLVRVWEAPRRFSGQRIGLWVLRGREDGSGSEAIVYTSTDGTTYTASGYQNYVCGYGTLAEDFFRTPTGYTPYRLVESSGPAFNINAANAARLLDLSGADTDWRQDKQVMLLKDEIMAVRSFTNEGGGIYRSDDAVREQLFTQPGQYAEGEESEVLIFEPENLSIISRTDWIPGQTIYVKVVPAGVSISEVDAIEVTLQGRAFGALPVQNILPDHWYLGTFDDPFDIQDFEFTWTNRINAGTGTGSGELMAGDAVPAYPGPEGDHIVRLYNAYDLLLGEYEADTPTSWTFTAAEQAATYMTDFPTNLKLEVVNRLNGIEGYPVKKTIVYIETLYA